MHCLNRYLCKFFVANFKLFLFPCLVTEPLLNQQKPSDDVIVGLVLLGNKEKPYGVYWQAVAHVFRASPIDLTVDLDSFALLQSTAMTAFCCANLMQENDL